MKVINYLAEALDGMAKGLFASLIVGVIVKQIGDICFERTNIEWFANIARFGLFAQYMMGPCIGAGIAVKKKAQIFTVLAAMAAGAIGAGTVYAAGDIYGIRIGEPAGALLAALCAIEIGRLIEGKTRFDLLIVPVVVLLTGGAVGITVSPVISDFMQWLGGRVNYFTEFMPALMGPLLGVVVGMTLTLPISSAALCIAIGIDGIAAGAALAGCCAQMVGFAAASWRDNGLSGGLAQGVGTSMLQVPNIIKNPVIWIAPTVSSAVCGFTAAVILKMQATHVGAGMGTAGLVGQFSTVSVMGQSAYIPILILHFIIPAVLTVIISEALRKAGLIKAGDMRIVSDSPHGSGADKK